MNFIKKYTLFFLLAGILCLFVICSTASLAKKNSASSQTLKAVSGEGESVVYGSILSPKDDEVNILLSKALLLKIRKAKTSRLSLKLTSVIDSTKTYNIANNAVSIQKKVISKKGGNYLVVSLFNLTTPSGITVSPSSLPTDDYKLNISGPELDITTDSFNYQTPTLIVGTVDSEKSGLVSIENLLGETISERTVAINPNGTFFTEVRANKVNELKAKKHLKAQTTSCTSLGKECSEHSACCSNRCSSRRGGKCISIPTREANGSP